MTVSKRDQRALIILGCAVVFVLLFSWLSGDSTPAAVVKPADSVQVAEKRLARVRRLAAQVPAKKKELQRLTAEVKEWEAGLIRTETAQQAQAELLQILKRVASRQAPAIEFRATEIGQLRQLRKGSNYGEVLVAVTFDCAVEQLVNLLADLTAQPEAIVTDELRIRSQNADQKVLRVRLSVSGLVPRELVPKQRGLVAF